MRHRHILIFMMFAVLAPAQTPLPSPLQRLGNAKLFAFGGIGYTGEISGGEQAFKLVLKEPIDQAIRSFQN